MTEVENVYCAVRTVSLYNKDKIRLQRVEYIWYMIKAQMRSVTQRREDGLFHVPDSFVTKLN